MVHEFFVRWAVLNGDSSEDRVLVRRLREDGERFDEGCLLGLLLVIPGVQLGDCRWLDVFPSMDEVVPLVPHVLVIELVGHGFVFLVGLDVCGEDHFVFAQNLEVPGRDHVVGVFRLLALELVVVQRHVSVVQQGPVPLVPFEELLTGGCSPETTLREESVRFRRFFVDPALEHHKEKQLSRRDYAETDPSKLGLVVVWAFDGGAQLIQRLLSLLENFALQTQSFFLLQATLPGCSCS